MSMNDLQGLTHAKKLIKENLETKATFLDLGNCGLRDLSELPELWKCQHLKELNMGPYFWDGNIIVESENVFGHNKIGPYGTKAIAEKLGQLTSLELDRNQISLEGVQIIAKNCKNLTSLNLSDNQIDNKGAIDIAENCKNLIYLNLGGNGIGSLGAQEIAKNCKNLTSLNLSRNLIKGIGAKAIAENCKSLRFLDLSWNNIGNEGAKVIGENLKDLRILYLYSNQIGEEGAKVIFENLDRIITLKLFPILVGKLTKDTFYNILNTFPKSVQELTEIKTLAVKSQEYEFAAGLRDFEFFLARESEISGRDEMNLIAENGPKFLFRYNKNSIPPPDIINEGSSAILEYFRQKENSGTKLLLEAKLLLMGDGRSGKTSLTCRMMGKDLPKEADRTPGVDIIVGAYSFPVKEGDFKLNIWDFGGQDKYKPLHQFFYSESAVYVMVADSGNAMTDFADWFETAELFGKGSPLIVVLNEFRDGLGYGIFDEERWRRQFPKLIRSVHMVNLLNQKGFPPVEQEIRHLAYQLPHVRYEYPENWANIRSELERRRDENFISLQEYLRICSANNLPERHSAMVLSSVLHNIGVCLHYQNNDLLSQHMILKNEWATTAVYKILEDHEVAEVKKGFFNLSDLHRIWTDDNYQNMIPQLLALMCEFMLAYPLPHKNEFVTPVLLPHSPPQDWQFNNTDYITALVEYEFLPKALMTQFIVCRHTDIDRERTLVWRDGVVLRWPSDTIAEIRKIKSRGRDAFQILVTGLERKGLLTLIIKTFRDLHTEYKGIRMNEVVPCPCKGCQQKKNQQHYFDLENLTNRLEKSRRKVECDKSLEEVDILQMLGDLFTLERLGFWDQEEKSNEGGVNQYVKTESSGKKVFISYSKSDEHYRNELEKHLSVLKRNGNISIWHDRKLLPGEKWDGKIKEEIKEADIILFLVSSDFLDTDYIWDVEIKGAIKRDQENKNVFVVPIIVRPCDWTDSPLGVYNSGTEKGRAISLADDTDAAFFEVVEKLKEIIKK